MNQLEWEDQMPLCTECWHALVTYREEIPVPYPYEEEVRLLNEWHAMDHPDFNAVPDLSRTDP